MNNDDGQRIEKRVTINKEFESFDAFVHEYVTNVSRSGVFIRSKEPLPVGPEVDLTFTVIMNHVEIIESTGQVVRVQDDPPGMGVAFTKLTKYSKDLLGRSQTRHGSSSG